MSPVSGQSEVHQGVSVGRSAPEPLVYSPDSPTEAPRKREGTVRRIAILVETSTSWGSLIVAGISDYARKLQLETGERWSLYVDPRGYFERQQLPESWSGDGVIARVTSPLLVQQIRMSNLPCVNVSQVVIPGANIQQVTSNQTEIGRVAAETLLRTGARSFGYIHPPARDFYDDEIVTSFTATLASEGMPASVTFDPDRFLRSDTSPHDLLVPLVRWIKEIPKPAAVLAWSFASAHRVCEACSAAGIDVPGEVSVLSADYDQLISDVCDPPLTCVDQSPRQVGLVAAMELARLIRGGAPEGPKLINPAGVIWRKSVLTEHISDELVSDVIRYIESNLAREISVRQLCEHAAVSRRKLEQHFHRSVGCGPVTYLHRLRLRRACLDLAETGLLIKQIAGRCGFRNTEQMQRLFKAETGLTPVQYREAYRRPHRGAAPQALGDHP